jgi:hypothetical protein
MMFMFCFDGGVVSQPNTFTCEVCGQTFEKGWTEAESRTEYKTLFPVERAAGVAVGQVCDSCHLVVMEWISTLSPERRAAMLREEKLRFAP